MTGLIDKAKAARNNNHNSHDIFRSRWSPRSMTEEPVSDGDLHAMFEAAHWAPSAFNNQPWRFLYARNGEPEWDTFFNLLGEWNQEWCKNASILVVIVAKTTFDHNGKPMPTHSYDTGAAWGMFALQGAMRGLVVHGMAGFDYDAAKEKLHIPDGYAVQAMAAVGHLDVPEKLSEDMRKSEKPSGRKELKQIVSKGSFTEDLK